MDYVRLGNTGLEVSKLCLGCMSYGDPARGGHPWSLPEDQSSPFLEKALNAGVNFFDTANVYSNGSSEEILGSALLKKVRRDEVVIATKVCGQMRPGPNGRGLSRKAILAEIDDSLRRLGTDYVDLYIITAGTPARRSRNRCRRCTMWSRRARCATWAPRRCGPGSSPRRCTYRSGTVGTGS